jgi:hypothetical protein
LQERFVDPASGQLDGNDSCHVGQPIRLGAAIFGAHRRSGDIVVDVIRTHPVIIIIGGMLRENPFFVPPVEFIRELRERRAREARPAPSA